MTQADLATRANVNRLTLSRLERGELTVSLDVLFRVLGVLGLDGDLDNVARDDELGRQLQGAPLQRPIQRKPTTP